MNRIAASCVLLLLLFSSCDNLFPPKRVNPAGRPKSNVVKNVAHIPEGCNLLDFIEDTTLDLDARMLCAGQQVQPVPLHLFEETKKCPPELRPVYLKAVTNISGYAFDDEIAGLSTLTLVDCSDWFFDVAAGSCFDEGDLGIWADNVILTFRKKRDANGIIEKDSVEGFLLVLKGRARTNTAPGREAFERFQEILRINWQDYLRDNGQAV